MLTTQRTNNNPPPTTTGALLGLALPAGSSSRLRRLSLACADVLIGDRRTAIRVVASAHGLGDGEGEEKEGEGDKEEDKAAKRALRGSIKELAASIFEPHFVRVLAVFSVGGPVKSACLGKMINMHALSHLPHHQQHNYQHQQNTRQATIEAQEAACELLFHWLTALRRLARRSKEEEQQEEKGRGKGKGKKGKGAEQLAKRFAEGLPTALRPLAAFKPPKGAEEGAEEEALEEFIGCVFGCWGEGHGCVCAVELLRITTIKSSSSLSLSLSLGHHRITTLLCMCAHAPPQTGGCWRAVTRRAATSCRWRAAP
jgi:hypothetical protein